MKQVRFKTAITHYGLRPSWVMGLIIVNTIQDRSRLVTLKVYDLLGNEVATLVNKELPAGSYTAEFSAAGLSSGVYIYTLKAGGYTQSKKMQVIK